MTLPPFLLLPGNMCDARLWRDTRFPDDAIIHHADLTDADTIAALAANALKQIDGVLIPVGFSMGGIVAAEMCRIAPERIAGLILLDTNIGADLPERSAVRIAQQQTVQQGKLAAIVADELKPAYLAAANEDKAEIRQLLFDMALALGPDVFICQSEALRTRSDNREVIAKMDIPVMLMCGEEDRLCLPAWHAKLAEHSHKATLCMIANAGHMVPLEQPEAMNTNIAHWITKNRGEICRA
jgi:pimeloyl-ACP methyl ester carboxylesterase